MRDYSIYFTRATANTVIDMGLLEVPTGSLYCCDPFLSDEVESFDRRVAPGRYPVKLCMIDQSDWGKRCALAALILSNEKSYKWEPASYTASGQVRSEFRVDAGLACFMDQETEARFRVTFQGFYAKLPAGNFYDDVLSAEFLGNADRDNPYDSGSWNMHRPTPGKNVNVAMFASGLGDGLYSCIWGLDRDSNPAILVADFNLLPD